MKNARLWLLLVPVLLSSCVPSTQVSLTADVPSARVVSISGGYRLSSALVPLGEVTAQTPDTAYVTFPECSTAAVAVPDVRRLGPDAALQACRAGDQALTRGRQTALALGAAGLVAFSVFLAWTIAQVGNTLQDAFTGAR
ncbi:hypothetical protein [Deinococcus planocerae]|uniref:hypothetical protein n=1 Tax=Deinococcus planocerae TaxID=1737569 RepID=UPI000C7E9339|nr:hypothetical protein [Deinococcus planocerae]